MSRMLSFAERNIKELLRDPLSYLFCIAFPLVMLIIMTLVNSTIPEEAGMVIFRIDNLSGGIAVFALTFIMLFTCLSVAKDRAGSFLVRLYASPMKSSDFIIGYILPCFGIAVAQLVLTFAASVIVGFITGVNLDIIGCLIAVLSLLPLAVMMIATGLIFGTIFSEKAAPGLCSIVISLSSFLGGVFFDVESTTAEGENFLSILCNVLPFFHGTKAARAAVVMDFSDYWVHIGITSAYALVLTVLAILLFRRKMKADLS